MRLRQLARKLEVETEKVIQFLALSGLPCEDDSNAKLSPEQEELLIREFGPLPEEYTPSTDTAEPEAVVTESEEINETISPEPVVENSDKEKAATIIDEVAEAELPAQEEINPEPEVIRAPKVELTGLKVVGKIELRTPKKKEVPEEEGLEEKTEAPNRPAKVRNGRNPQRKKQERKSNPIAEQRKREEKIKQRKKKEAEELARKKRKENYLKKIKTKEKPIAKKVKVKSAESKPRPDTTEKIGVIKKFFNWMRRE